MKEKIIAIFVFIITVSFVIINTLLLQKTVDNMSELANEIVTDGDDAEKTVLALDKLFREKVGYIGLTVSHDDITNIEDCIAELQGYIKVGDNEGAEVTKSRLIRFLGHLRRLVGFNIDAII